MTKGNIYLDTTWKEILSGEGSFQILNVNGVEVSPGTTAPTNSIGAMIFDHKEKLSNTDIS